MTSVSLKSHASSRAQRFMSYISYQYLLSNLVSQPISLEKIISNYLENQRLIWNAVPGETSVNISGLKQLKIEITSRIVIGCANMN